MYTVHHFSCALAAWSRHSRSHRFNACTLSAQAHGSHSMTFHAGIKDGLRDKVFWILQNIWNLWWLQILQLQAGDRSKMPTLCSTSDCFATGWDNQDDRNPAMKASPAPVASTTPWMRTAGQKQRKQEYPARIRNEKVYVSNQTCQLEACLPGGHIDRGHIVPIHCASMRPLSNDLRTPSHQILVVDWLGSSRCLLRMQKRSVEEQPKFALKRWSLFVFMWNLLRLRLSSVLDISCTLPIVVSLCTVSMYKSTPSWFNWVVIRRFPRRARIEWSVSGQRAAQRCSPSETFALNSSTEVIVIHVSPRHCVAIMFRYFSHLLVS